MNNIKGIKFNTLGVVLGLAIAAASFSALIPGKAYAACGSTVCGSQIVAYPAYNPSAGGGYSGASSSYGGNASAGVVTATAMSGNPVPSITAISPNSSASGSSALLVTVTGQNFVPASVVRWNSQSRDTTYLDQNHLAVKLSGADLSGQGQYLVTVFNPGPGGGYSNSVVFSLGQQGPSASYGTTTSASTSAGTVLAANASKSGFGFFPSTFTGWLLLAILIFIIVMIWRKIYLSEKKKKDDLQSQELAHQAHA